MLSQDAVEKALARAQESASHSWEYSTVFEALLEYRDPQFSVFHHDPFPRGEVPTLAIEEVEALRYVRPYIRTDSATLSEGNGSSGDPTSLILPALLLSRSPSLPEQARAAYDTALSRQLLFLFQLTRTPRFPNGAISHRDTYPSLWADFIYMAPPVLAYLGVSTRDVDMARMSVRQCEWYGEVLATPSGLWRHIANHETAVEKPNIKTDDGAWCTSNAWAGAGMARVLATLRHSQFASDTAIEQRSLITMTKGILDGAMQVDTHSSHLLRNYLDDDSWFGDVAGTALMASAAFRMAVLEPDVFDKRYTAWATTKMDAVARHIDSETGIAAPVVNSLKERQSTPLNGINPEGQAFVVLLYAAWRDWKATTGENTA